MGFVGVVSLFEIIIADVVPFPWRVIAFYLPATPYFVSQLRFRKDDLNSLHDFSPF